MGVLGNIIIIIIIIINNDTCVLGNIIIIIINNAPCVLGNIIIIIINATCVREIQSTTALAKAVFNSKMAHLSSKPPFRKATSGVQHFEYGLVGGGGC